MKSVCCPMTLDLPNMTRENFAECLNFDEFLNFVHNEPEIIENDRTIKMFFDYENEEKIIIIEEAYINGWERIFDTTTNKFSFDKWSWQFVAMEWFDYIAEAALEEAV